MHNEPFYKRWYIWGAAGFIVFCSAIALLGPREEVYVISVPSAPIELVIEDTAVATVIETAEQAETRTFAQPTAEIAEEIYILNTKTKKFHKPTCSSAQRMAEANRGTAQTREEAVEKGYTPCGVCKP